jgi:hypothetical protein
MEEIDYLRSFLSNVGIAADVQLDSTNQTLIVIAADEYSRRRGWIEAWFTMIGADDQFCYFRERMRGTGETL